MKPPQTNVADLLSMRSLKLKMVPFRASCARDGAGIAVQ